MREQVQRQGSFFANGDFVANGFALHDVPRCEGIYCLHRPWYVSAVPPSSSEDADCKLKIPNISLRRRFHSMAPPLS